MYLNAPPEKRFAQKNVLVVDDDAPINELVKLVLETRGYTVTTAADGQQALDSIRRSPPDLVVLDVMLPEVSGFDVCRIIKGDNALKTIKVVMLSAKPLDLDKQKAEDYGADAYLIKPVFLSNLLDTVNQMLFPDMQGLSFPEKG